MNAAGITYEEILSAIENYEDHDEQVFLRGLESRDVYVVWAAIKGCGLKRIQASIPKLVETLGKPSVPLENTDCRRIAAWSLAKMGFDRLAPYVSDIDQEPNPLLREGFADALGMTRDERALSILDRLLEDEDTDVLLWVALSLAKLGKAALPIIKRHLERDPPFSKAVYLIDALKNIGTPAAHEIAQKYLASTEFPQLKAFLK